MSQNLEISKNQNYDLEILSEIDQELVWLENFISEDTKKTYKAAIKKFCNILSIQNFEQFREVESIHIIKFRDELRAKGESHATINNRLSALSSLFKFLIEKQVVKKNPVYGVKAMKKAYTHVKSRALEDEEAQALLNAPDTTTLKGLRDKAILSIFFNLGPRRGSISKLRGKNIFEESGYLIFDMYIKGDRRSRVAVNSHIQATLKEYLEAMGYYRYDSLGNGILNIPDNAPIFPNLSNNPKLRDPSKSMTESGIYYVWKSYAKKLGIERSSPHCGRTTFITKAFDMGVDLRKTQETVAHANPGTTLSYCKSKAKYKNSASFSVSFG